MTNKDILNYVRLKDELVEIANRYIRDYQIPATIQRAIFDEVVRALTDASDSEIKDALAEEKEEQDKATPCDECEIPEA